MSDATLLPLAQRLMESAKAWLTTAIDAGVDPTGAFETARQLVVGVTPRLQDEDTVITPQTDADKKIRVILHAMDEGQIAPQVQVIRKIRLEFHVRGNALVNNGLSEPFVAMCGAVEKLLDGMNMKQQLSSDTWAIAVMKAPRALGVARQVEGHIRTHIYALDIAAVGTEHVSESESTPPVGGGTDTNMITGSQTLTSGATTFNVVISPALSGPVRFAWASLVAPGSNDAIFANWRPTADTDKAVFDLSAALPASGYVAHWGYITPTA